MSVETRAAIIGAIAGAIAAAVLSSIFMYFTTISGLKAEIALLHGEINSITREGIDRRVTKALNEQLPDMLAAEAKGRVTESDLPGLIAQIEADRDSTAEAAEKCATWAAGCLGKYKEASDWVEKIEGFDVESMEKLESLLEVSESSILTLAKFSANIARSVHYGHTADLETQVGHTREFVRKLMDERESHPPG